MSDWDNQTESVDQQPGSSFPEPDAQPVVQEDVPAESNDEVETETDEEVGSDEEIETNLRGGYELNWADAAAIAQFAVSMNAKPPEYREFFSSVVNFWGDSVAVARGIYPPGINVEAIDLVSEFIDVVTNDQSRTMELTVRVMEQGADMFRAMTRIFSAMVEEYPADEESAALAFKYRANMNNMEVLLRFNGMVPAINEEGRNMLAWAQEMIAIWPGEH